MKLTVTELRQVIREVISESLPSWDDDEDEDVDPVVIQDPNGPLRWQEEDGHKYVYTKQGVYDWSPSTGYLSFVSNFNGRTSLLSKDLNPRRSGGFHDMKSEEHATARVKQHAMRQK
jgi:hypothetical protein